MLNPKQSECLKFMLEGKWTQKQIAEKINVTSKTVSTWKKDVPEFMEEFKSSVSVSIGSAAAQAINAMIMLLNSKNPMVVYLSAKDILDRSGYKLDNKIKFEGSIPVVLIGEDKLEN